MIWPWYKILGLIFAIIWITGGIVGFVARKVWREVRRVFWPWWMLVACTSVGEPPKDAGSDRDPDRDPCTACYYSCNGLPDDVSARNCAWDCYDYVCHPDD